jgi:hypothetical protein
VERGACLSGYELRFMRAVVVDVITAQRVADHYPEYRNLVDRVAALYGEIVDRATQNEQRAVQSRM